MLLKDLLVDQGSQDLLSVLVPLVALVIPVDPVQHIAGRKSQRQNTVTKQIHNKCNHTVSYGKMKCISSAQKKHLSGTLDISCTQQPPLKEHNRRDGFWHWREPVVCVLH